MLKAYSITSRLLQITGVLILAGSAFLAAAFLYGGDRPASLFCGAAALASAIVVILAGRMRKQMKAWSDKFPPSLR
ncbi:hypothetical protein [Brevundimonas faecalis]